MLKNKDLCAGAMFIVFGAVVLVMGRGLPRLQYGEIGPGAFPTIIGVLLGVVGVLTILSALRNPELLSMAKGELRAALFVLAGIFAFGLLVRPTGLIPAVMALVIISSFANRVVRPLRVLAIGVGLTVMCWLIFIVLLQLPVRLFILPGL